MEGQCRCVVQVKHLNSGGVGDEIWQVSDTAVNVDPEHHLGWVLVADLANEADLATGDICPVLTGTLLNLKQLVLNS